MNRAGTLWKTVEHYGTLSNIMEHYGSSWNMMENIALGDSILVPSGSPTESRAVKMLMSDRRRDAEAMTATLIL